MLLFTNVVLSPELIPESYDEESYRAKMCCRACAAGAADATGVELVLSGGCCLCAEGNEGDDDDELDADVAIVLPRDADADEEPASSTT